MTSSPDYRNRRNDSVLSLDRTYSLWICGLHFAGIGLPQYHLGQILDVGNDQKPLRRRRVWIVACEHLERSDCLDNACAVWICLQDRKWLKFAERLVI